MQPVNGGVDLEQCMHAKSETANMINRILYKNQFIQTLAT